MPRKKRLLQNANILQVTLSAALMWRQRCDAWTQPGEKMRGLNKEGEGEKGRGESERY